MDGVLTFVVCGRGFDVDVYLGGVLVSVDGVLVFVVGSVLVSVRCGWCFDVFSLWIKF